MGLYDICQGKKIVKIELPDNWKVNEVPMGDMPPLVRADLKIKELLKKPIAGPPLADLVKPGEQVAICVSDISRPCPEIVILPPILEELEKAGIKRDSITIIIGNGTHRAMNMEEIKTKYGPDIAHNYRIMNHDARNVNMLHNFGRTPLGVPIVLNSILKYVHHIIAVGQVEVHPFAGFSGGAKAIAVGCAGEEKIKYSHSAYFLEASGAGPGIIEGNIFQQTLWEVVAPIPFDFAVNVILNEREEIVEVSAGEPREVFVSLVQKAEDYFVYEVSEGFEIVYLGVPYPRDINLYQATKAANYVASTDYPPIIKGSVINMLCECPEGFGEGVGEQRFRDLLKRYPDPRKLYEDLKDKDTQAGEQRAFLMAKVMMDYPVNVVGTAITPEDLRETHFRYQEIVPKYLKNRPTKALVAKDGSKKLIRLKV